MADLSISSFGSSTASTSSTSNTNSTKNYKQYPPEQALQMYMSDNNCDEATAKAALEKMYGKPSAEGTNGTNGASGTEINGNELNGSNNGIVEYNQGSNYKEDFDNQLKLLGIPADIVNTHDQNQIKDYATQHNITLPDPPQKAQSLDFSS